MKLLSIMELLQYAHEHDVRDAIYNSIDHATSIQFNKEGIAYIDNYSDIYSDMKFEVKA